MSEEKCNAEWQVYARFNGLVRDWEWTISVAFCGLEKRHPGKHKAVTKSPVNGELAYIIW